MLHRFAPIVLVPLLVACTFVAGCPGDFDDFLEEIEIDIDRSPDIIQGGFLPPPGFTEEIIIEERVEVITDITQPIFVEDLDFVVLGFENLTGFDIYLEYVITDPFEGEIFQSVLVFDGELLLLEYPCFDFMDLLIEDHFVPGTNVFVEGFDLNIPYDEGFEYFCGDALIITFTPDEIFEEAFPL